MSNHVTITGRLGDDIELRFTPQGKAVANGRVADTPRRLNPQTNQWEDSGETLWITFSIWDRKAEALTEAAHKGDLVTVTGTLIARSWQTQTGENRTVTEIKAADVAVVPKLTAQPQGAQSQAGQPTQGGWGGQPATFNAQQAQQTGKGWGGGGMPASVHGDEPPFGA